MAENERRLEEARAAQQAAYEQQLKAQQEQYERQKAEAEAARQAEIERQAAARQAEIERRAAEKAAKEAANKKSWSNANAAAAGMTGGSAGPAYTKKYGQGSNAGGLMSGVNSVRGRPHVYDTDANAELPTGGAGSQPGRPPVDGIMPNGKASNMGSTPWADAFLRSKKAAEAPGPVSGMMSKWME
jgi:membrane protein involved in colicin uptake